MSTLGITVDGLDERVGMSRQGKPTPEIHLIVTTDYGATGEIKMSSQDYRTMDELSLAIALMTKRNQLDRALLLTRDGGDALIADQEAELENLKSQKK